MELKTGTVVQSLRGRDEGLFAVDATAGLHIWQTGGQDWWKSPKRRTSVTFV